MLKVGIIGCGFMGTMHANCYKNLDGVTLTAVADIRPEKAEQLADGAQIFGDGKDLINNAKKTKMEEDRKVMADINDYIKNYSDLTFEEYKQLKYNNK